MPAPKVQGIESKRKDTPQKVFVYGTLKKGFHNHAHYLSGAKDLGVATIEGIMFHLGGCPAITLCEPFHKIIGEVYEVSWKMIDAMDLLEGVGRNFYDRVEAKVHPHGNVWMYVFPYDRAAKEEFVIPGGLWQGPGTIQAKWKGFGKGIEIGSFETRISEDTIKVGVGNGAYELRRSPMDQTYKLINKKTGEVLGSYKHLRDMMSQTGVRKPVLRLPAITQPTASLQPPFTVIPPQQQHPSLPIIWTPPDTTPEVEEPKENIPQAARLLNLKYGAA